MPKKKKEKTNPLDQYTDFGTILVLSERLAQYLRLLFKLDKATWNFALDKIRQGKAYKEWRKFKGRGKGYRHFAAPCAELKTVQRAIKAQFLDQIPIHFSRYGCQGGTGIVEHAAAHMGNKAAFGVDIINAYPTVLRSRIRKCLQKPFRFMLRQFGDVDWLEDDVKNMLESVVDLLCLHDRLPQGPPTSPRILGIVCYKMDTALFSYLNERTSPLQGFSMTSWFDDITVSSDKEIPEEMRDKILALIKEHGFIPHTRPDKTKYFSPETGEVPIVTGVVICPDGRLTMAPRKVNQLRAAFNNWLKIEVWDEHILGKVNGTLGAVRQLYPEKLPSKLRVLVGKVEDRLHAGKVARSLQHLDNSLLPSGLQDLAKQLSMTVLDGQGDISSQLLGDNLLFVDGAARKSYQAGIGAVLIKDRTEVSTISQLIGKATSNQAEYQAILVGLKAAKELGITELDCFTDSMLVVNQLNGKFAVSKPHLRTLVAQVKALVTEIGTVRFHHVPREMNTSAHSLAHMALK